MTDSKEVGGHCGGGDQEGFSEEVTLKQRPECT